MDAKQFEEFILRPSLNELFPEVNSLEVAYKLVFETIWHESNQLKYIYQRPSGPASGFLQMEKPTFDWLIDDFLPKHKVWPKFAVISGSYPRIPYSELFWNLKLNVVMCRVRYLAVEDPLPEDTLEARSDYWFRFYNASGINIVKHHYQINAKELEKLLL